MNDYLNPLLQAQCNAPNDLQRYLQQQVPMLPQPARKMTREDLGIIDRLLDDKIGMEP